MLIIAHRINTVKQLKKVPKEMGVEIDVRACGDDLILNHEPHEKGESLNDYLDEYDHSFIVFNIKEDGIEDEVVGMAEERGITDYFLLDVEYPYIYRSTRKNNFRKLAIRYSEAETIDMALSHKGLIDWVWVDTNTRLPLNNKIYSTLKEAGFKLCLVGPDRWGRPEDIKKYKEQMEKEGIEIDAVMTELSLAGEWV